MVDVPIWVTYLNWTLIFEWHVTKCGCKNGYEKDTYKKNLDYVLKT